MAKEDNRFQIVSQDKSITRESDVLRDRETGVLYLFHINGYAGGLTVLVDRDGKPLTQLFDQQ